MDYYHDVGVGWIINFEIKMKIELKDKKVLVLGLGETGLSALRWLERQGAILSVADSRDNPPSVDDVIKRMPQVLVHTGAFKPEVFLSAD